MNLKKSETIAFQQKALARCADISTNLGYITLSSFAFPIILNKGGYRGPLAGFFFTFFFWIFAFYCDRILIKQNVIKKGIYATMVN